MRIIGLYLVLLAAIAAPGYADNGSGNIPVIALIGDSTVTDKNGWGQGFAELLDGRAEVHNFAVGGRGAKSYTDEERLPEALAIHPDYVFIQFGHNGQPGKGEYRETDPQGSYRDYLRGFVAAIRAAGAEPIIVSSLTRRHFDDEGHIVSTLHPWAEGARAVAEELDVPFVNLHARSIEYHDRIGPEDSARLNYAPDDQTHLNAFGSLEIAALVLAALADLDHPLAIE
jgi:pectinesterase